jgi:hypothetical protein
MALYVMNAVETIEIMENYISKIRPPKEMRDKLDINYRIENQSIILFEIRPVWNDKTKYLTHDFAKTTFDKKNSAWKIYWLRANLKWNLYKPKPTVQKLPDFLKVIDLDKFGCFKG